MAQSDYYSCHCCGRVYKNDGSESELFEQDHADDREDDQ